MLRSSDVARHRFLQQIVRQHRVPHERILVSRPRRVLQSLDQPRVLILQLLRVRPLDLLDLVFQRDDTSRGGVEHGSCEVDGERLDADVVDVVGFVEDDDGVFRHLAGDLFGDFGVEEVVEGIDDHVAVRKLRPSSAASRFGRKADAPFDGRQSTDRCRSRCRTT